MQHHSAKLVTAFRSKPCECQSASMQSVQHYARATVGTRTRLNDRCAPGSANVMEQVIDHICHKIANVFRKIANVLPCPEFRLMVRTKRRVCTESKSSDNCKSLRDRHQSGGGARNILSINWVCRFPALFRLAAEAFVFAPRRTFNGALKLQTAHLQPLAD